MATIKKEKIWLVTYGVCFDKPRYIEHATVGYTDDSTLKGIELVADINKQCKAHADLFIAKGTIHSVWIHLMVMLGLSLLFICPTIAQSFQSCQKMYDNDCNRYSVSYTASAKSLSVYQPCVANPVIMDISSPIIRYYKQEGRKFISIKNKEYVATIEYDSRINHVKIERLWDLQPFYLYSS